MHTRFREHQAVGVIADDRHRRPLDACFVAGLQIDDVALEPAAFRPPQIHPQQHLRPVLRLGPPRARVDAHDRVLEIVLAAEHLLRLAGIDLGREFVEPAAEVFEHRFPGLHPLHEHGEILHPSPQGIGQVAVLLQPPAALQQLLRACLILPEVRIRDALLYRREFLCGAGRVKDSSADRRRGAPGPDTCEAVRPDGGSYKHVCELCAACQAPRAGRATCWTCDVLNCYVLDILSRSRRVASSAARVSASDSHATASPIRL